MTDTGIGMAKTGFPAGMPVFACDIIDLPDTEKVDIYTGML